MLWRDYLIEIRRPRIVLGVGLTLTVLTVLWCLFIDSDCYLTEQIEEEIIDAFGGVFGVERHPYEQDGP